MPYEKCKNIEQENAIEELKIRAKNKLTSPALLEDEALLYKFLKARDFNVDKAEKLLKKHIVWRKVFQVDQIVESFKPKEIYVKYVEPNLIGFDKDGDIVRFIAVGRLNATDFFKCMKLNDCVRHWIWFAEKNKRLANETGRKISMCVIVDLDKLELANATSKLTIDILLRLATVLRDNYAERIKALYIINAPSYFVLLYTIIKTVLPNFLINRIHVFGYSGWTEKLSEAIDADVLPAYLGGSRTDPDGDPYCKSFITLPGIIPESYYLSEEERYFENPSEVIVSVIPPSEKKEIFVNIKEVGSSIRWKFMVRSKTIRFGLFFQETQKEAKEIIPMYEYVTSDGTEENSYKCFSEGKYVIVFDNSHSRISSKEVQYVISVMKPQI